MIRDTGWSGGQYSLFRTLFGIYLTVHFAHLIPWGAELFSNEGVLADGSLSPLMRAFPNVLLLTDAPWLVTFLLGLATAASVAFALGWRDRWAAVLIWYVSACVFGRDPLIANPSLPFVGWMLLAHALLPRAPFGSLDARGRVDPRGAWRFPAPIFAAAWIVVLTSDGNALVRSDAVLHIGGRLGGAWRVLAVAGRLVPRPVRDVGYDFVASIRRRLFTKPSDACPVLPPDLRARFSH